MLAEDRRPGVDPVLTQAFFRRAGVGAVVVNRVRKVLSINPASETLTGWTTRDLTQATCRGWSCRDERGRPVCGDDCLARRCIESGEAIGPLYLKISTADGRAVACEAQFVPLQPDDTRNGTCLITLMDVTVLEGLDAAVRQRDQELAELRMAVRRVAEQLGVAWRTSLAELRTCLNGLRAEPGRVESERGRLIERAQGSTQKLEALFGQLVSRLREVTPPKP